MAALDIGTEDLVENPTPRVPVALCIDTSGSMMGNPIRELVAGVNQFYDAIDEDDDPLPCEDQIRLSHKPRAVLGPVAVGRKIPKSLTPKQ